MFEILINVLKTGKLFFGVIQRFYSNDIHSNISALIVAPSSVKMAR